MCGGGRYTYGFVYIAALMSVFLDLSTTPKFSDLPSLFFCKGLGPAYIQPPFLVPSYESHRHDASELKQFFEHGVAD